MIRRRRKRGRCAGRSSEREEIEREEEEGERGKDVREGVQRGKKLRGKRKKVK